MSTKPSAKLIKETEEDLSLESFSLQSIGAYMMFKPVDEDSAEKLCEFIIKANYIFPPSQPLTIMLNSPGGSVYDGFGIIDLMESSKLKIQTVAIGVVASMAATIFIAGTKGMRTMSRNSYIMTHQFNQWFEGKYHEFIARRKHEDDLHDRFIKHFSRYSKMTEKQVADIFLNSSDVWLDAKESLKLGLCDRIQDPWS